jgi:hypothetical protein
MAHSKITSESYPYDLPLTSRDSDNEDTSVHTPVAHKRSASEMDDERDNPGLTTVQEGPSNGSEAIGTEIHTSFIIECPALSAILEKTAASDAYSERDHPTPAPELSVQFTVRPGKKWSGLSRYKNAKCKRYLYNVVHCANGYFIVYSPRPSCSYLFVRPNCLRQPTNAASTGSSGRCIGR